MWPVDSWDTTQAVISKHIIYDLIRARETCMLGHVREHYSCRGRQMLTLFTVTQIYELSHGHSC